jgi:hypothetical protein
MNVQWKDQCRTGAISQRYSPDQPALSHFARRLNYILIYIRSVPRECGTHGKCMSERLQPLCFIIPPEFCTTTFSHCQLFHLRSNLKRTRQNDRRLLRLSCSCGAQFGWVTPISVSLIFLGVV